MNIANDEQVSSKHATRFTGSRWVLRLAVVAAVVALAVIFIDRTIGVQYRCVRVADAILKDIDLLVLRAPKDVTQEQWDVAIYWTHNLHCNSLLAFEVPLGDIREFRAELETRIRSNVDMSTVDWIWERYAVLTQSGREYQKYRTVMRNDMSVILEDARRVDPHGDYKRFRLSVESRQRQ